MAMSKTAIAATGSAFLCMSVFAVDAVAVRPVDFDNNQNCVTASGSRQEVFMVAPWLTDWKEGTSRSVESIEYFSGRQLIGQLTMSASRFGVLKSEGLSIELDCSPNVGFGADEPIDSSGDFFAVWNVDDEGQVGPDVMSDPDGLGTQGLVRQHKNGELVWSSLIVVRNRAIKGHPIYAMKDWYRIEDRNFVSQRILSDGTLLLVYPNRFAFRVWLSDGRLVGTHPDIRVVDLKAWADFKRRTHDDVFSICKPDAPSKACNAGQLDATYLRRLRKFLFNDSSTDSERT